MASQHRVHSASRPARAVRLMSSALCLGLMSALIPAPGASADPGPTPTLTFTAAPTTADPGTVFGVAPSVTVTDSTDPVTLTLTVDAGEPSGKLSCPSVTVTPVDGVATFPDCKVDKGGKYRLRASLGAVTADSDPVKVSGPAYVAFSTQPTGGLAGDSWLGQPVAPPSRARTPRTPPRQSTASRPSPAARSTGRARSTGSTPSMSTTAPSARARPSTSAPARRPP